MEKWLQEMLCATLTTRSMEWLVYTIDTHTKICSMGEKHSLQEMQNMYHLLRNDMI